MKRLALLLLLPLLLLAAPGAGQARVYLDITSPEMRKIPVAIPPFIDQAKPEAIHPSGRDMANLLGRALVFHGFASLIDPNLYGGRQDANWPSLGAEFVLLGQYRTEASGITLELRLLDVNEGRMILGRRYQTPWTGHRQVVLKFCDEVVHALTGEMGISRSKIAFSSDKSGDKEIFITDILGDEITQVTKHKYLAIAPRFLPDGRRLTYTSYHRGNPNLYLTDFRDLKTTRAISRWPGLNITPAWAPDGKSMVLTLSKDGNPDLYQMDDQGRIMARLTSGEGANVSPNFSPDGRQIAFVSDRSGSPQIYLMDLKSRAVRRLTFQGNDNTTPAWSPKGDWIAYTGRGDAGLQIYLIRPEGGAPVQLTKTWGEHESPSWAPDGRQLVFSRKRNSREQLCAIFSNGSGLRVLFETEAGNQSMPQWSHRLE